MSSTQKLRDATDRWMSARKTRNLSLLAKLSKVSYSTVRRIMQAETESTGNTLMKLASVVMSKVELSSFASEFFPNLVTDRIDVSLQSEDDLLSLIDDENYIPLLLLASHRDGTNENEVRFFFGQKFTHRFHELINLEHLNKADGDNWRLEKDIGSVDLDTARKWISIMASICPTENDNVKSASIAHVGFESVNFETAVALYHAGMDFVRTSIKLTSDKKNRGSILVMFGTLFNVLKGSEAYK